MTSRHTLTFELRGEVPTLIVTGDLDLNAVEQISAEERAALDVLASPGPVVVDLTDVAFMDSSGLGLLIGIVRGAGQVHLLGVGRRTRRLLEVAGVADLFSYADPTDAQPDLDPV